MEEVPRFGGKHSFSVLWRFNPEWYRLIGSRCKKCSTVHYPRKAVCVYPCPSHNLEDVQLSHTGTIVYGGLPPRGTGGYSDIQPQFLATIQLDDGPHLMAEIVNVPADLVRKMALDIKERKKLYGARVRMVFRRFRKHDSGDITYGHKFEMMEKIK